MVMDLCSIAETCMRFRQIVESFIPNKISIRSTGNGVCEVRWRQFSGRYIESEFDRVLRNFGSTLSALSISDFELPYLLQMALENCSDNLEILRISNSSIPAISTVKLTQLTSLQLDKVDIAPNVSFAGLVSLVELKVVWVRNGRAVLLSHFPKLRHFTYFGNIRSSNLLLFTRFFARWSRPSKIAHTPNVLSTFFHCNKTLKTVDLILDNFADRDIIVLKAIVSSCKELDVLRVNCGNVVYTDLIEPMKSNEPLGYVELSKGSCKDLDIFSSLATLRTLCLYCCNLPTPSQFTSLTHVTRLELQAFDFPNMLDVVGIISQLVNLESFSINLTWSGVSFVLDRKTFEKIVVVVKERENALTLRCKTAFILKDFERNDKVHLIRLRPYEL